jgi:hypothetical protein
MKVEQLGGTPSQFSEVNYNYKDKEDEFKNANDEVNGITPTSQHHFNLGFSENGFTKEHHEFRFVLHHGEAYRSYISFKIADLLNINKLLPLTNYSSDFHKKDYTKEIKDEELGTALLSYSPGPTLTEAYINDDLSSLLYCWENGDLIRLWITHFLVNNLHPSHVTLPVKHDLQVLDNTQAFFELPFGYCKKNGQTVKSNLKILPQYIQMFVDSDNKYSEFISFNKVFNNTIKEDFFQQIVQEFDSEEFKIFGEYVYNRAKIIKNKVLVNNIDHIIKSLKNIWINGGLND